MRVAITLALLLLAGCADSAFAFRGIKSGQDCDAARRAEVSRGSTFVGEEHPLPDEEIYHQYRYDGRLYGTRVEVRIGCVDIGRPRRAVTFDLSYAMKTDEDSSARAYMESVVANLAKSYGSPIREPVGPFERAGLGTFAGERATFVCSDSSVAGYALEVVRRSRTESDPTSEVWVFVTFHPVGC